MQTSPFSPRMNLNLRKISILCFAVLSVVSAQAQYTKANDDPDTDFKLAKELYQKEQFSLAYPLFKMLYAENKTNSSIPATIQSESKYYSIVCGLQMNDITAVDAAMEFIDLEHHEPRIQMMCFHLGEYYYRKWPCYCFNCKWERESDCFNQNVVGEWTCKLQRLKGSRNIPLHSVVIE